MPTYALIGGITIMAGAKIAKRDAIYAKIETFLSGKPVWGQTEMGKGTDLGGNPNMAVTVRFTQRPDLDNLFALAKTELNKLTGVKASVSIHICFHDEDPVRPCVIEELATIVK